MHVLTHQCLKFASNVVHSLPIATSSVVAKKQFLLPIGSRMTENDKILMEEGSEAFRIPNVTQNDQVAVL